jgi:integrase
VGYPYGKIIQFLLLTGCRVSEVALARWKEFDLKGAMWTIPKARFKVKAAHRVPLTPHMLDLLSSLPRWPAGDYLFTFNGSKPFNGFSTSKRLFDRHIEMPMEEWIRHDLRRTMRTRLAALKIPEPIAELAIGHAKKGLKRVYDQYEYAEEIREAFTKWNVALAAIVEPPPDNVITLKKLPKASKV